MHVKILFKANDLKEEELYFCEGQYFRRKSDGKNLEFYEVANSEIKTINTLNEKKFDWKKKVVWKLLGNYEEFIKGLDADGKTGFVFAKAYKLQEGDVININDFVFKYGENAEDLDKEKRFESEKQPRKPDENKLTDASQAPNILESVVVRTLLDRNDSKSDKNSFGNATDLRCFENNNESQENRYHSENLPDKPEKNELVNPIGVVKSKYDSPIGDEKVNEIKKKAVKTITRMEFVSPKEKIEHSNPDMTRFVSNSNGNFDENEKKIEEDPLCCIPEELQNLVKNISNENFESDEQKIEEPPTKIDECKEKIAETRLSLDIASQKQKLNELNPEIATFVSNSNEDFEPNEEKIKEASPLNLHNLITTSNENFERNEQKIEDPSPNPNIKDLQNLDPDSLYNETAIKNLINTQPDSDQIDEQILLDKHPNYETPSEEQSKETLQITDEADHQPEFTEIPIKITHYHQTPPLNLIIEHKSTYNITINLYFTINKNLFILVDTLI